MFEPIDFPTSLPTWPSPKCWTEPLPEPEPVRPRSRSHGRMGAIAIAIGLVLGGLGWAYWRSKARSDAPEQPTASSSTPAPASTPMPTPEPLWVPRTGAEFHQLAETIRTWMRLVPHADDLELARVVWGFHWRGVPFPQPSHDAEYPPALELLERVIAAVRADDAESASDAGAEAGESSSDARAEANDPIASTPEASVRDTPTPGCFYRVRHDDELLGAAGIAARALCEATKDAARRRGWSRERADARAKRLASKPSAQAAYAELIQRSEYNPDGQIALVEGDQLWLPPLRTSGLLNRDRRRPVVLDARPWPDGSSRLEPPPTTHPMVLADAGEQIDEPVGELVNVELTPFVPVPEAAGW